MESAEQPEPGVTMELTASAKLRSAELVGSVEPAERMARSTDSALSLTSAWIVSMKLDELPAEQL